MGSLYVIADSTGNPSGHHRYPGCLRAQGPIEGRLADLRDEAPPGAALNVSAPSRGHRATGGHRRFRVGDTTSRTRPWLGMICLGICFWVAAAEQDHFEPVACSSLTTVRIESGSRKRVKASTVDVFYERAANSKLWKHRV